MKIVDLIKELQNYKKKFGKNCEVEIMVDFHYSDALTIKESVSSDNKTIIVICDNDTINNF